MRTIKVVLLASTMLAVACDGGNGDADGGADACTSCMADTGPMPMPDSGPTGDGNDSFATAAEITVDDADATRGAINPARDLDYYTFEGTAGQWIEVVATTDDTAMPRADTVITIYDSAMNRIAENDDGLPRTDVDPELITRLPADGTYYVLVQEWSTWADDTPVGGSRYTYDLRVLNLVANTLVNIDTEPNDASAPQALTEQALTGGGASFVLGTFEDDTDVDVYTFTIAGTTDASYGVNLMPVGDTANGAAANPARLSITNADGSETIARIDPSVFDPLGSGENAELPPSLAPGDYRLVVEGGGDADFYVLKIFRGGDNPPEGDDTLNSVIATPDPISFTANPDIPGLRSGFVLAHLGDADVDHFAITTLDGEQVTISCGSASLGSGVQGLTAELVDPTGTTTHAMGTEGADGLLIEDVDVPAGDYVIRLTKTGQDPEVTGDYVRCGFHLQPPAP